MHKLGTAPRFNPQEEIGSAALTGVECLMIAAWREENLDMLARIINTRVAPGGLRLVWQDPAFTDDTETDE
jgi:hypothetical protein